MTDIVARYNSARFMPAPAQMMKEAIDEVVRLRAENETLRRDVKTAIMGDSAELQDVKRENEKLKAILIELADEYEQFAYEGAEIALLKEARAAAAAIRESGE